MEFDQKTRIRCRGFFDTIRNQSGSMDVVPGEWVHELYNYVICGLPPGSFHTACFANDLFGAAHKTHHSNTWPAITGMVKWFSWNAPHQCYGSYEKVTEWIKMDRTERDKILLAHRFIVTDEELTFKILETE